MPRMNPDGSRPFARKQTAKRENVFESPEAQVKEGFASIAWADASAGQIQQTLNVVTEVGGAILFARTSDGGALSVTLFYGDDKKKIYIAPGDDPDEVLKFWQGFFDNLKV